MAISAGDFKTGLTLIVDGDPWVVLDFQHVKPGKGAAILKTKMKNLKTGNTSSMVIPTGSLIPMCSFFRAL